MRTPHEIAHPAPISVELQHMIDDCSFRKVSAPMVSVASNPTSTWHARMICTRPSIRSDDRGRIRKTAPAGRSWAIPNMSTDRGARRTQALR
jgi:hypothetical protein